MRYLLLLLIGVVLLAWLLTGVTQVQPGEKAVVRRFGRVLQEQPGPGLHVGLPWGIDRVDRVPLTRERSLRVGYDPDASESFLVTPPGQLLTGDHNLINAQIVVDYTLALVIHGPGTISLPAEDVAAGVVLHWLLIHCHEDRISLRKRFPRSFLLEKHHTCLCSSERLESIDVEPHHGQDPRSVCNPPTEILGTRVI